MNFGDMAKIAGNVVGNFVCPGVGGVVGGIAGGIVGDAIDGDKKEQAQTQNKSNPLGLAFALAGGNTAGGSLDTAGISEFAGSLFG